jgi:hypothetical protein
VADRAIQSAISACGSSPAVGVWSIPLSTSAYPPNPNSRNGTTMTRSPAVSRSSTHRRIWASARSRASGQADRCSAIFRAVPRFRRSTRTRSPLLRIPLSTRRPRRRSRWAREVAGRISRGRSLPTTQRSGTSCSAYRILRCWAAAPSETRTERRIRGSRHLGVAVLKSTFAAADRLWLNAIYTYNGFFFDDDPVYGDNHLPGVPAPPGSFRSPITSPGSAAAPGS